MYIRNLLLLAPYALAARLRVIIPVSAILPNPSVLPATTTASLSTLTQIVTTHLRVDNSFDFNNVTAGSYLLDIQCSTHTFLPARVDVRDGIELENGQERHTHEIEVYGTFRGNEWGNKGPVVEVKAVDDGLSGRVMAVELNPQGTKEYLVERTGFSPLSLLKNPMILIAGVSLAVVFGMPYLVDNMDPEIRAEFEERQKSSPISGGQAVNPLQNFDAAAWLSGSSSSQGTKKSEQMAERGITR